MPGEGDKTGVCVCVLSGQSQVNKWLCMSAGKPQGNSIMMSADCS